MGLRWTLQWRSRMHARTHAPCALLHRTAPLPPCAPQERNSSTSANDPEASRKTATARRKIGSLGALAEKLLRWLDSPEAASL